MRSPIFAALLLGLGACQGEEAPMAATTAASPAAPMASPPQQQDFAMLCSPCHGPGGQGDGPEAARLGKTPTDLTGLAAGNGGSFPMGRVMGHIWGYTEAKGQPEPGRVMPDFGALLDSETVLFDAGDGISTPTPSRLVELALYIKALQQ